MEGVKALNLVLNIFVCLFLIYFLFFRFFSFYSILSLFFIVIFFVLIILEHLTGLVLTGLPTKNSNVNRLIKTDIFSVFNLKICCSELFKLHLSPSNSRTSSVEYY